MSTSSNDSQHPSADVCYRHPERHAEKQIQGIPMCSECVTNSENARKKSIRKAVSTRLRNAARRLQPGYVDDYETWQGAIQQELAKTSCHGVAQVLKRPEVEPHVPELLGRLFQYCSPAVRGNDRIVAFRDALLSAPKHLRKSAADLRNLRQFDNLLLRLNSYVMDQVALNPNIASKAGEWIIPELRPTFNVERGRLEPERLEDVAHDLTSLAAALKSIVNSLLKQADGLATPILVYMDLYFKTLLDPSSTSSLLVRFINAGFAAIGSDSRMKQVVLRKRLRDYEDRHPISLHQLRLRVRLMIEGPEVVEEPGVRAYSTELEQVSLPTGRYALLPRVPLLPPLPRRTER